MFNWFFRKSDPVTSQQASNTIKTRRAVVDTLMKGNYNAGEISDLTGAKRDAVTPELNRLRMKGYAKTTGQYRPPFHQDGYRRQQVWCLTDYGFQRFGEDLPLNES